MAGRGRGRGRGNTLSFNLDAFGIKREDINTSLDPRPRQVFPPVARLPIPVQLSELDESTKRILEIKEDMRRKRRQSPFFIDFNKKKKDIDRYCDKFQINQKDQWTPDWTLFPEELQPKKPKQSKRLNVQPNIKAARNSKAKKSFNRDDILAKIKTQLDTVSTADGNQEDEEKEVEVKEEVEDEEQEQEEDEEEDEEAEKEEEEDTDYTMNYFDNGEGYGDEDEEDDEPAYS